MQSVIKKIMSGIALLFLLAGFLLLRQEPVWGQVCDSSACTYHNEIKCYNCGPGEPYPPKQCCDYDLVCVIKTPYGNCHCCDDTGSCYYTECGAIPGGGGGDGGTCGDGSCNNGESCATCPTDCGVCPTSTPLPSCPNGTCGAGESCVNCPADCGACPTPLPTSTPTVTPTRTPTPTQVIQSTINVGGGAIVSSSGPTCAEAQASTDYISNTISLSPGGAPQNVAPGGTATWLMPAGTYTVSDSPPAGYVLQIACWQTDSPAVQGTGLTAGVADYQTITWTLGYGDAAGWTQVAGGYVWANSSITSYISEGASSQYFVLDGAGGRPGVVSHGGSYDFDASPTGQGAGNVSSTAWHVSETYDVADWYSTMYYRFDSTTTEDYSSA